MRLAFLCKPVSAAPVQPSQPASAAAPQPAPVPASSPAAQTPAPTPAPAPAPQPELQKVVEPAPVSEETSVDTQQPRERRARAARSSGISMKAMMTEEPVATPAVSKEAPAPSEESIRAAWPTLAQKYADKPRLLTMLNTTTLQISGDDISRTVVFEVLSQAQKEWVESKLLYDLEGNLRALLKTVKIYLRVSVRPDDAPREKKIYMPSEQADVLMKENMEVTSLIKDLQLDIK